MKNIVVCGNVGKDAETRKTGSGDAVTSFSVAVEERKGQDKSTIWFDVSIWGARGEKLAGYITKGTKVAVSGDLGKREHEGKTYLTVRADQVTLLGSKSDGAREQSQEPRREQQPASRQELDDEIPF
jgi:single-strand DNA-binding protein